MGTFILGIEFTDEEVNEIMTNPLYKDTLAKNILDLRKANEALMESIRQTWLFRMLYKLLDDLSRRENR